MQTIMFRIIKRTGNKNQTETLLIEYQQEGPGFGEGIT